jgi:hypothetical protein
VTQGRADYRFAEKLGALESIENIEMDEGREGYVTVSLSSNATAPANSARPADRDGCRR